jgi:hypothetical protein
MTLACIIKLEMIVIDDPSLCKRHQLRSSVSDNTRSVNYDRNMFIIQATGSKIQY